MKKLLIVMFVLFVMFAAASAMQAVEAGINANEKFFAAHIVQAAAQAQSAEQADVPGASDTPAEETEEEEPAEVTGEPKQEQTEEPEEVTEEPKQEQTEEPAEVTEEPKQEQTEEPEEVTEEPKQEQTEEPEEVTEEPKQEQTEEPSEVTEEPKQEQTEEPTEVTEEPKQEQTEEPGEVTEEPKQEQTEEPAEEKGVQFNVTVFITGTQATAIFDGDSHDVSGYTVDFITCEVENAPEGEEISCPKYTESDFAFTGEAHVYRTDIGTSYMELSADQFENLNDQFNVTFEVTAGYIAVEPEGYEEEEEKITETDDLSEGNLPADGTGEPEVTEPAAKKEEKKAILSINDTDPELPDQDPDPSKPADGTEVTEGDPEADSDDDDDDTVTDPAADPDDDDDTVTDPAADSDDDDDDTVTDPAADPDDDDNDTVTDPAADSDDNDDDTVTDPAADPKSGDDDDDTVTDPAADPDADDKDAAPRTGTVAAETVIRTGTGEDDEVLLTADEDMKLTVLSVEGEWAMVELEDGTTGYVALADITLPEEKTDETAPENVISSDDNTVTDPAADPDGDDKDAAPRTGTVAAETVILSGTGENDEVLLTADEDMVLTVLSVEDEWVLVQLTDGTIGYVALADITLPEAETAEEKAETLMLSTSVVVRLAADGMSEIISTADEGQELTVLGREGDWVKVQLADGTIGYVDSYDVANDVEAQPEKPAEILEVVEEEQVVDKKVTIFTSRHAHMRKGEGIELTSRLEGFENVESVRYQWECDKGSGFEPVDGAIESSYSYEANAETLTWSWRLTVYYK